MIQFKKIAVSLVALSLCTIQIQAIQAQAAQAQAIHGQTIQGQTLYSIDKTKILLVAKEHIAAVLPQVEKNALVFRGFTYINRPKLSDADRLQVEYCWGAKIKSAADTFDIVGTTAKEAGYFNMVSVEVSADGAVDNARIEKVLLSSAGEGDPCVTTGAQ